MGEVLSYEEKKYIVIRSGELAAKVMDEVVEKFGENRLSIGIGIDLVNHTLARLALFLLEINPDVSSEKITETLSLTLQNNIESYWKDFKKFHNGKKQ